MRRWTAVGEGHAHDEPMEGGTPVRATEQELRESGWCLALLATLRGHDLLLARREAWGPRALVALVLEALGRSEPDACAERIAGGLRAAPRGQGYELALVAAELVRAAQAAGVLDQLELKPEGGVDGTRLLLPAGRLEDREFLAGLRRLERLLPGTVVRTAGGRGPALDLPRGWVAGGGQA